MHMLTLAGTHSASGLWKGLGERSCLSLERRLKARSERLREARAAENAEKPLCEAASPSPSRAALSRGWRIVDGEILFDSGVQAVATAQAAVRGREGGGERRRRKKMSACMRVYECFNTLTGIGICVS
jgi:hypothetical protein